MTREYTADDDALLAFESYKVKSLDYYLSAWFNCAHIQR